jgi:apolipoprotein N-acyltransferase
VSVAPPAVLPQRSLALGCLSAAVAGAIATLSLPPYDVWMVLPACFTALVWLVDGAAARRSFWRGFAIGWSFAFGYFVPSLWWISEAFWVEPEKFAALIPFAVAGLPSYLALYWGAATGLAARIASKGISRIVLLAVFLAIAEWLRGHLLTGFPWNLPGYGISSFEGLSQAASLGGIYSLTMLVMLAAMAPAAFWQADRAAAFYSATVFCLLVYGMLAGLQFWGSQRIQAYDATVASADPLQLKQVRIVQPSIPQQHKWDPARRQQIIDTYLSLTSQPWTAATTEPPLVLWPESALPLLLAEEDALRARIFELLPEGALLFTGGLHRTADPDSTARIYNSLMVLSKPGQVLARHDKVRLVPFGEFLPFSFILEPLGIRQLARLPSGFSEGAADRVIKVPGVPPFAGFICYEAVFPRSIPYRDTPELLINVTNDAWFGTSGGPHQHLVQSRFRAIEQGVPLIRAANTGISAMVDATGRAMATLPLQKTGVLDMPLPPVLGSTWYHRLGDGVFVILLTLALVANLICRRNNL